MSSDESRYRTENASKRRRQRGLRGAGSARKKELPGSVAESPGADYEMPRRTKAATSRLLNRTSERDNRGACERPPLFFPPGLSLSDNYCDSEASRKRSEEDSGTHGKSDFSVSGCFLTPPETHPDPVSGRFVTLRPYLRKRGFGMPKGGVTTR